MTKDSRDLRDPQKLGQAILGHRKHWQGFAEAEGYDPKTNPSLSTIVDYAQEQGYLNVPNYPQDESCATVTAREYRAELQEAAEKGDKYAASRLAGLDEGSGAGGDPAGS
jgi:hypothetical protein